MDNRRQKLKNQYHERFHSNVAYRDKVWGPLCSIVFSQYIKPEHTVLDLGAGWGEFTRNICALKKYAMDLNPDTVHHVANHAEFFNQDCSEKWPLEDETLDVVFSSNFFEHLPNKALIEKSIGEAYRTLKKGGLIICLGPNVQCLNGSYWDYWDHYTPITSSSMAEVLKINHFAIIRKVDRFIPYTMSSKANPPLFAVKIYLKMPIIWPIFGKQFLVVGRK